MAIVPRLAFMPLSFALMMVIVNSEPVELPPGTTVADLVSRSPRERSACAVEVNRRVVPRKDHGSHVLRDGDRVELVTLVGGG